MKDAMTVSDLSPQDITVLIADDHALVRDGIKLLVGSILGKVRFVEADDGQSLLRVLQQHRSIRLGLVDLNMPGMERGLRLTELARGHPALPLVVVSALTSPDVVRRTLDIANVFAFVPKSASPGHMAAAVVAAMQGTRLPFTQMMDTGRQRDIGLTPRMEEVRSLLRQGMSNKMIASTLGLSEGTVKNYMSEIFKVLHVSNRTQAAQLDLDRL